MLTSRSLRSDDKEHRHRLLNEPSDIELSVLRTRRHSCVAVVRANTRRADHIDRIILGCFVLGLSTRKLAEALLPALGRPVSATIACKAAKDRDAVVEMCVYCCAPQ